MAETAEFAIGAEASATDGPVGKVSRVVVDPVAKALTHLVVEPGLRQGPSRLVPLDLVDGGGASEVRLSCTKAEFENLEPAEETKFIPRTTSFGSYGAGDVLSWPYYGAAGIGDLDGIGGAGGMGTEDGSPVPRTVTYDTVPVGEVGVRRGQPVLATDGAIGHVQGLVVRPDTGHVTHVLLQEGHLWGKKEVAIPISAVDTTVDGTQLKIAKQDVENLPPVDISHPE
jgi:sporulation protein YlmC with PRC-barrel domain